MTSKHFSSISSHFPWFWVKKKFKIPLKIVSHYPLHKFTKTAKNWHNPLQFPPNQKAEQIAWKMQSQSEFFKATFYNKTTRHEPSKLIQTRRVQLYLTIAFHKLQSIAIITELLKEETFSRISQVWRLFRQRYRRYIDISEKSGNVREWLWKGLRVRRRQREKEKRTA